MDLGDRSEGEGSAGPLCGAGAGLVSLALGGPRSYRGGVGPEGVSLATIGLVGSSAVLLVWCENW